MIRSKVRNKYLKWPCKENLSVYKKAKFYKKAMFPQEKHFQRLASKITITNKKFWNIVKPFITSKSVPENTFIHFCSHCSIEHVPISLKIKNEAVTEEQKLVHEFNVYYTNIVQNTTGRIPSKVGAINQSLTDIEIVNRMIDSYKKHPSMKLIEENLSQKDSFHFANASARDVNRII